MKIKYVFILLLLTFLIRSGPARCQVSSAEPKPASEPPKHTLNQILDNIEKNYAVPGFRADFLQKSTIKAIDITDRASGRIFVMRPNRMRWEYDEPDKQIIITNGNKLWIYRPEDNQVMLGNTPDIFGDGKGAGFLSDMKIIREKFLISLEKSENKFFYILKLLPKHESNDLSKIFLSISKSTFKVMQIITYNSYGDKTRIDLINTIFSREPDPSLFIFAAPEGVDVLTLDR